MNQKAPSKKSKFGSTRRNWALDPNQVFDFGEWKGTRMEGPWRLLGCPGCGDHHYCDEDCSILKVVPMGRDGANKQVKEWHRHHKAVVGYKFAVGLLFNDILCGVAIAGRPVSRMLDDGMTLEITRVATDGTFNACSKLYGACAAAAKGMGYTNIITYTLPSEGGASLRGAGFTCEGEAGGGSWDRAKRKREDKHPTEKKLRWIRILTEL